MLAKLTSKNQLRGRRMEALLTQYEKQIGAKWTPTSEALERQWMEDRPRYVAWLRERHLYRATLSQVKETAGAVFAGLIEASGDPFAAGEEMNKILYLPEEERVPELPPEQAPFGQPTKDWTPAPRPASSSRPRSKRN